MKKIKGIIHLSASDLVGHLNCNHLSALDVQVASGLLTKPDNYDPLLEILRDRGHRHEQAFIEHLQTSGYDITIIEGSDITDEAVEATSDAMRAGKDIISQGALRHERWSGRADILRRIESPSDFGDWVSVKKKLELSMDQTEVDAVKKGRKVCKKHKSGDALEGKSC